MDNYEQACTVVMAGAAMIVIAVQGAGGVWMYHIGLTALAAGLAALLVLMVGRAPSRLVASRGIKAVALASYSIYLIHPLMIHPARKIMERLPLPGPVYFPWVLALVACGGAAFYFCVEHAAVVLRDRWYPRRSASQAI